MLMEQIYNSKDLLGSRTEIYNDIYNMWSSKKIDVKTCVELLTRLADEKIQTKSVEFIINRILLDFISMNMDLEEFEAIMVKLNGSKMSIISINLIYNVIPFVTLLDYLKDFGSIVTSRFDKFNISHQLVIFMYNIKEVPDIETTRYYYGDCHKLIKQSLKEFLVEGNYNAAASIFSNPHDYYNIATVDRIFRSLYEDINREASSKIFKEDLDFLSKYIL